MHRPYRALRPAPRQVCLTEPRRLLYVGRPASDGRTSACRLRSAAAASALSTGSGRNPAVRAPIRMSISVAQKGSRRVVQRRPGAGHVF
jgi:hypothetical protein